MPGEVLVTLSELAALASKVAREVRGGDTLLLYGELGSGKTTFVQALAGSLGVKEKLTSPTFTITAYYDIARHPSLTKLVHVDLYRLEEGEAAQDAAVRDLLEEVGRGDQLTVIEWADRLGSFEIGRAGKLWFRHSEDARLRAVRLEMPRGG